MGLILDITIQLILQVLLLGRVVVGGLLLALPLHSLSLHTLDHIEIHSHRLVLIVAGLAILTHLILMMVHPSLKILVHLHVSLLLD